jgi:hypothetical protein
MPNFQYQLNISKQNYNVLIFYRDTSTAVDAADSRGNNIFPNGIMKLQLELQRWPHEFVISFSNSIYLGFGIYLFGSSQSSSPGNVECPLSKNKKI